MSVVIFTDSTSDFSLAEAKSLGVEVASLKVAFGNEEFIDKVTITNDEFYEKLRASKTLPKTTLVSPQTFIELFNKHPNDEIVGIFISSELSGTFQSAVIAKYELGRDDIYLVDSGTSSLGLAMLVDEAVKLRNEGKDASRIFSAIDMLKEKVRIIAAVDTLEYLVKGGRLPASAGVVGSILNIKPILLVSEGKITPISKSRGMKNAVKEIHKIYKNLEPNTEMPIIFAHAGNSANLHSIKSEFDLSFIARILTIGSVVGTHSGPGVVAVAFFVQ